MLLHADMCRGLTFTLPRTTEPEEGHSVQGQAGLTVARDAARPRHPNGMGERVGRRRGTQGHGPMDSAQLHALISYTCGGPYTHRWPTGRPRVPSRRAIATGGPGRSPGWTSPPACTRTHPSSRAVVVADPPGVGMIWGFAGKPPSTTRSWPPSEVCAAWTVRPHTRFVSSHRRLSHRAPAGAVILLARRVHAAGQAAVLDGLFEAHPGGLLAAETEGEPAPPESFLSRPEPAGLHVLHTPCGLRRRGLRC